MIIGRMYVMCTKSPKHGKRNIRVIRWAPHSSGDIVLDRIGYSSCLGSVKYSHMPSRGYYKAPLDLSGDTVAGRPVRKYRMPPQVRSLHRHERAWNHGEMGPCTCFLEPFFCAVVFEALQFQPHQKTMNEASIRHSEVVSSHFWQFWR